MAKKRVGIFAGAFDPVHAGHISFALQAAKEAKLDQVIFLPERRPRHKPDVEHFGHRTAMIARAIRPYKNLAMLELPDMYFDVPRTLPKLQKEFVGSELVFLMGSDAVSQLNTTNWPPADLHTFLRASSLIIALRAEDDHTAVQQTITALPIPPKSVDIMIASDHHVSSSNVRQALRRNRAAVGLLPSVYRYARAQWLYASPSND